MTLLLMTPGPTRVPDSVRAAGAMAMIHHRSEEFSTMLGAAIEKLRPLFGAGGDILPVHATGRGALEASVTNLLSPGEEIIVCCNGFFGEMWARIASQFGIVIHKVCSGWERTANAQDIEAALLARPQARAVLLIHSDTSNGALNDVEAVGRVCRRHQALLMVDAVSSLGGVPFRFDDWGVDVAVTASQKCLMSSPGLSFVAVSEKAWQAQKLSRMPRAYFDFPAIRRTLAGARPETPGTTPVHLIAQVNAALTQIHTEGMENVFARHEEMARMLRTGAADLGMPLQCAGFPRFSPTLTAVQAPPDVPPQTLRECLKARGILTASGLGGYASTCFRIGHMGDIRPEDVEITLDALRQILAEAARH